MEYLPSQNLPDTFIKASLLDLNEDCLALSNFFSYYTVDQVQKSISQLVEVAITTENDSFRNAKDREELLFFQKLLLQEIKAAYSLQKRLELETNF